MRISDWSSDVCSSDLRRPRHRLGACGADTILDEPPRPRSLHCLSGKPARLPPDLPPRRRPRSTWRPMRDGDRRRVRAIGLVLRTGGRSEEHTSELQSLMRISYAVFCLKKKKTEETRYTP